MEHHRAKRQRKLLPSLLKPGSRQNFQPEGQHSRQDSASLSNSDKMKLVELVKQLKELDALNEEITDDEDLPGNSTSIDDPCSKNPAADKEGMGSGVAESFAVDDKSLSSLDESSTKELVHSAEVIMEEPGSCSSTGPAVEAAAAGAFGADMQGILEGVSNVSEDDKQLTEKLDEKIIDDEEVRIKFLQAVLEGKNEKARNEMKGLMYIILGKNSLHDDLKKESFYAACEGCLQLLKHHFIKAAAASLDLEALGQIMRQAGNLDWLVSILIDREIADDFVTIWASQSELSDVYYEVAAPHRYEVSRVTATLLAGIGQGKLYVYKDVRYLLLKTWLVPLCDDFEWMRKSKGTDRNLIEHGLGGTIFSLPLPKQQELLSVWFDKFLNSVKECPNLKRGFELWWTKAFGR